MASYPLFGGLKGLWAVLCWGGSAAVRIQEHSLTCPPLQCQQLQGGLGMCSHFPSLWLFHLGSMAFRQKRVITESEK